MFGIYRYLLAIFVSLFHLTPIPLIGLWSVFSFYTLSGFLMTLILNANYGFESPGLKRYFANRFLRIYPPYYALLLIGLVAVFAMPQTAYFINPVMHQPKNIGDWLLNFSLLGLDWDRKCRIIPPAWSIHTEVFFYILIPFIARKKNWALAWMALSAALAAFVVLKGYPLNMRYYDSLSASLPFSIGSCLFFFRGELAGALKKPAAHVAIAGALFILNMTAAVLGWWGGRTFDASFYINVLLSAHLTISLFLVKERAGPALLKVDKFLGDLSYPIFLSHWTVSVIVAGLWPSLIPRSFTAYLVILPAFHAVALAVHFLIDRNVNRVRDRVRKGA